MPALMQKAAGSFRVKHLCFSNCYAWVVGYKGYLFVTSQINLGLKDCSFENDILQTPNLI